MDATESSGTGGFQHFAYALFDEVGPKPTREVLEQHVCFAAAVWNAVVMLGELEDETVLQKLVREVKALEEPARSRFSNLLVKLALYKARRFAHDKSVLRNVHVTREEDDQLHIRAELLDVHAWVASGEPLRMGIVA